MMPRCLSDPVNMPNLVEQIREALSMFALDDTKPALIGGLAVVAHSVVRHQGRGLFIGSRSCGSGA